MESVGHIRHLRVEVLLLSLKTALIATKPITNKAEKAYELVVCDIPMVMVILDFFIETIIRA